MLEFIGDGMEFRKPVAPLDVANVHKHVFCARRHTARTLPIFGDRDEHPRIAANGPDPSSRRRLPAQQWKPFVDQAVAGRQGQVPDPNVIGAAPVYPADVVAHETNGERPPRP